jgi:hypothetical protein
MRVGSREHYFAQILISRADFSIMLTNNIALNETWRSFDVPVVLHSTIASDGYGAFLASLSLKPF